MYLTSNEINDLITACTVDDYSYLTSWQTNDVEEDAKTAQEHNRIQVLKQKLKQELEERKTRKKKRSYVNCHLENYDIIVNKKQKEGWFLVSKEQYDDKLRLLFIKDWR